MILSEVEINIFFFEYKYLYKILLFLSVFPRFIGDDPDGVRFDYSGDFVLDIFCLVGSAD